MKKMLLAVIALFIVTALFIVSSGRYASSQRIENMNGGDDDAGRDAYELVMLRDPATGKIPAYIREKELAYAATLPTDAGTQSSLSRTTTLSWAQRGPWNVGGRTRAFAIDATNENNLIAGSTSGAMWRSTNQGTTWTPTTPANQYKSVTCVAQDTRHGHTNVWYYGSGEGSGASASAAGAYYYGDGVYKSTDSGQTWTALPSTIPTTLTSFNTWSQITWNIVTNPADTVNDVVYVAAYGSIYKSMDGGTTWASVLGGNSYYTDIAITSTGVLYASLSSGGTASGIYRSTDGVTFTNITPTGFPTTYDRVKIGISPSDESQVYFLSNNGAGFGTPNSSYLGDVEWNGLWKYKYISGDGTGAGGIWNDYSAHLPVNGYFNSYSCQGSYDMVVKIKPTDTNIVFIGGQNLFRSTSGFADSVNSMQVGGYQFAASLPVVNDYPNHHPDQHELVFLPSNPDIMFSTNDGGIFMTTDNTADTVAWTPLNNGYVTTMFYTCAIDHAMTNNIVIGGAQDNGSWYTNSASLTAPWVTPRSGDGTFCAIADSGKAYYFSIQDCKMMRAKLNASGGVDSFARIDPIGGFGYLFVNPFILDPNNNNIMYMAGGRCLWRNSNLSGIPYAGNWDTISTNWEKFSDSLPSGNTISAIAVSTVPANRVYYGSDEGRLYRIDGANAGDPTPTSIRPPAFPLGGNVSCIAVDPTNADHILVTCSNYNVYSLFYSPDGGSMWYKVGGNLEESSSGSGNGPSLRWASIVPLTTGAMYLVGSSVGLFATNTLDTSADGTVWVQQGASTIGSSIVNMIDYRTTDGLVVVATHSSGIFSAYIPNINTAASNVATTKFDLNFTNYPNPFSDMTTIQFDLKENAYVTLMVYDENGRLVKTLANGPMTAGEKKYSFQRDILSSGIYYCTLSGGGQTETRKLLLLQ